MAVVMVWARAQERALRSHGQAARLVIMVAAVLLTVAVAGCGSAAGSSTAVTCGTTRTAANVPVHIQIIRGKVACSTALQIERDYAQAIESGKVPGAGSGAPVHLQGWTCQGFATPEVLKTGNASKCTDGTSEIMAVLPAPS